MIIYTIMPDYGNAAYAWVKKTREACGGESGIRMRKRGSYTGLEGSKGL